MALSENKRAGAIAEAAPAGEDTATYLPFMASADSRRRRRAHYDRKQHHAPVPVEATVHWWRTDERRAACSPNQFGVMPTTPVRFRCIGTLIAKYPKRYRVELVQALDWLPELTCRELKELGASLATAISVKLGLEVAPFSQDLIDLDLTAVDV